MLDKFQDGNVEEEICVKMTKRTYGMVSHQPCRGWKARPVDRRERGKEQLVSRFFGTLPILHFPFSM